MMRSRLSIWFTFLREICDSSRAPNAIIRAIMCAHALDAGLHPFFTSHHFFERDFRTIGRRTAMSVTSRSPRRRMIQGYFGRQRILRYITKLVLGWRRT